MDWAFALCGGGGGGGIVQREHVGYQEEVAKPAVLLNNHDDPGNHFPCSLPHLVLWWTAVRITQKSTHAVWPPFSGAVKKEEKEKVYCTWYIYIYIYLWNCRKVGHRTLGWPLLYEGGGQDIFFFPCKLFLYIRFVFDIFFLNGWAPLQHSNSDRRMHLFWKNWKIFLSRQCAGQVWCC